MSWIELTLLSILQGLTEFLPVSSSAHIFLAAKLLFKNDPGTSFTAIIQLGTTLALLIYLRKDIYNILTSWLQGLISTKQRKNPNYILGWYIIVGSLPVGILGFLFQDSIKNALRNIYFTATMLILFGVILYIAEKVGAKKINLSQINLKTVLLIGLAQGIALLPGVSRSGATISAGLLLGLQRKSAVKLSFYLAIPVEIMSGIFSLQDLLNNRLTISTIQIVVAVVITFIVGYLLINWFMAYISSNSLNIFAFYRVILGVFIFVILGTGLANLS